jgi:hypothetical protein
MAFSTTKDTKDTKSEHKASKSLLEQQDIEIHQKSESATGEPQVGQQLRLMKGGEPVDRLHFDDERLFDEEVEAIIYVDAHAFVMDREGRLAAQRYPSNAEFVGQAVLISRLEQTWSKRLVDLQPCINDDMGNPFQIGRDPFVSFVVQRVCSPPSVDAPRLGYCLSQIHKHDNVGL